MFTSMSNVSVLNYSKLINPEIISERELDTYFALMLGKKSLPEFHHSHRWFVERFGYPQTEVPLYWPFVEAKNIWWYLETWLPWHDYFAYLPEAE